MIRNLTALLLAGALLFALCSCGPGSQPGEDVSSGGLPGSISAPPDPAPDCSKEEETPPEVDLTPEKQPQTPADTLVWESDHELDTKFRPENHGGLELPVRGPRDILRWNWACGRFAPI